MLQLQDTLPFGRYKDSITIEEIIKLDPKYVYWVLVNYINYSFDVAIHSTTKQALKDLNDSLNEEYYQVQESV